MKQLGTAPNPALKDLDFLIGEWNAEIFNARFLPDKSAILRGEASVERLEDGSFLLMRQGKKTSGPPYSTWVIGRDDTTGNYSVLYFDDRNVSRVYQMSFAGVEWRIWRDVSGFYQRFKGEVARDFKTISASWEMSSDGTKWEHDFDLRYSKRD